MKFDEARGKRIRMLVDVGASYLATTAWPRSASRIGLKRSEGRGSWWYSYAPLRRRLLARHGRDQPEVLAVTLAIGIHTGQPGHGPSTRQTSRIV